LSRLVNKPAVIGLDLGSSYVKLVSLNSDSSIARTQACKTGYSYAEVVPSLIAGLGSKPPIIGVTGYGKSQLEGTVHKTEISALARGMKSYGFNDATLVDIGGQDCKILKIKSGKLVDHAMNRRCAAGTGSYLEYLSFRMDIDIAEMNRLAAGERDYHPFNSFCTVFAGTEILDCIKKNIPISQLIRGLYASIAVRIREILPLEAPVYLSGGVIAHHPVLREVFQMVLGMEIEVVPEPQFLAALGIALIAKTKSMSEGQ
jgi:(R)-2-hydroxyacyl-CoA dehydratese activating ATPase